MSGYLLAVIGLVGGLFVAAIGDMVSEEVRDRFDHMPDSILRLAAHRLDPSERSSIYDKEWLPELTYILQGDEARPVTRLYQGTRFAVGILLAARRITRNLRTAPIAGSTRPEFRLDGLQADGGQRSAGRTVRHLVLGSHLRRLREAAGLTSEEAAAAITGSRSDVLLMEHGRGEFGEGDIADLLTLYGIGPGEDRDWLLRVAREVSVPGWWNAHSDAPTLPWAEPYLGLEAAASAIHVYEPQFVPGLLQTEDYARAIIQMDNMASEEEIIRRAETTMWRKTILLRQPPPKLWAVVDEGALHRPIGGREVMVAQLRHLMDMCDQPTLTLQVLPFTVGAHRAMHGGVTVLRYAEPDQPDIAYIEQYLGVLYLDKRAEVKGYLGMIEEVCLKAAPATHTKAILKRCLSEI